LRVRLVLVGTEGPVNLGFIARLAENFEVDEIYLVNPLAGVEEAARYAARAAHRLREARIVDRLDDALQGVSLSACTSAHKSRGDDILRVAVSPRELARLAAGRDLVAVVMGRESTGLTREEISKCDVLVNIPTSDRYPSLNLSNATAIILYELFHARISGHWRPRAQPDPHQKMLLIDYFSRIAGLVAPHKQEEATRAFKAVLTRAEASLEEVRSLLYIMSRAWRRLSQEPGVQGGTADS